MFIHFCQHLRHFLFSHLPYANFLQICKLLFLSVYLTVQKMCFLLHVKYIRQFESSVPAVILSLVDGQKAKWYKSLTFCKIFLGWVLSVSEGKSKIFYFNSIISNVSCFIWHVFQKLEWGRMNGERSITEIWVKAM